MTATKTAMTISIFTYAYTRPVAQLIVFMFDRVTAVTAIIIVLSTGDYTSLLLIPGPIVKSFVSPLI